MSLVQDDQIKKIKLTIENQDGFIMFGSDTLGELGKVIKKYESGHNMNEIDVPVHPHYISLYSNNTIKISNIDMYVMSKPFIQAYAFLHSEDNIEPLSMVKGFTLLSYDTLRCDEEGTYMNLSNSTIYNNDTVIKGDSFGKGSIIKLNNGTIIQAYSNNEVKMFTVSLMKIK
jgi:hypothetical protein